MYNKKDQNFEITKRENAVTSGSDNWNTVNHACNVCGLSFRDALELLAHAESHARSRNNRYFYLFKCYFYFFFGIR